MIIDYNPHLGSKAEVVAQNMGLVHYIANKFRSRINQNLDYDDLVSEGVIGLIKAFEYFDPSKFEGGIKFATYAVPMIKGYIQRLSREKGSSVRVPRSILDIVAAINQKDLYEYSATEIAEETGCSLKQVDLALQYLQNPGVSSLDQFVSEESETATLVDLVPSHEDFTGMFVDEFIDQLSPREKVIVGMCLAGANQDSIATETGISQSYISRIMVKIGNKLKKYMGIEEREVIQVKDATSRKATSDEAKRYGIRTIMDDIEWFIDGNVPTNPTIGLNAQGLHLNAMAVRTLECCAGNCLMIGINPKSLQLVVKVETNGIKLRKAYGESGSLAIINKRLVSWMDEKHIERKRYVLQHDETSGAYFLQLEEAKGGK